MVVLIGLLVVLVIVAVLVSRSGPMRRRRQRAFERRWVDRGAHSGAPVHERVPYHGSGPWGGGDGGGGAGGGGN